MKFYALILCSLAATASAAAPPQGVSPGPSTITRWQGTHISLSGQVCGDILCEFFVVETYVDLDGVPQGRVFVQLYDGDRNPYVNCMGSEYAKAASLVAGNGSSIINLTINPAAAGCFADGINAPISLNLTGQFNGEYKVSNRGTGEQEFGGMTFRTNTQSNGYSSTFNGNGAFLSGPFMGAASAERQTSRTRVR